MNDCDKETASKTCGPCREKTVQEILREIIDLKEDQLADLKALVNNLPVEMSYRAERAMRELLIPVILRN